MFSIIIPYFNKAKYIQRCLNSVLNQSVQDFEILLIDDGSTDEGLQFISDNYSSKLTIIRQENQGVSAARNKGIENAKHPFIAFLDADDCWHHQFLEKVKEVIEKELNVKIIGAHYSRDKEFLTANVDNLDYFKFENYFKSAPHNTYFTSSSTIITADFFSKNKGFNTDLKNGEDIDLWIRTVHSGGNAYYIKNTLAYYSDEDENQTTNSKGNLEQTLVGIINTNYKDALKISLDKDFNRFVCIYVYFNLYSYYYDSKYHLQAKETLKKNEIHFYFLSLVYKLPFTLGKKITNSSTGVRWLRLFMKFVIRYTMPS